MLPGLLLLLHQLTARVLNVHWGPRARQVHGSIRCLLQSCRTMHLRPAAFFCKLRLPLLLLLLLMLLACWC
jgi:hypothetical protein